MHSRHDRWIAVAMIAPSVVLLAIFVYGFIGQTVYVSLTDWGAGAALAAAPKLLLVGLDNYKGLFTGFLDVRFRQDMVNMVVLTLLFVGGCLGVGLLLATLVDQRIRGEGFFRTLFLFPLSLSFVVTGTIWRWMLQPRGGVNVLPTVVGLPKLELTWLTGRGAWALLDWSRLPLIAAAAATAASCVGAFRSWRRGTARARWVWAAAVAGGLAATVWASGRSILPFPEIHGMNFALVGLVLAAVWQMSGYTMALFLAGLRSIPDEVREAARVDGCSRVQVYWLIELPLMRPIIWSAVIILGHIALKSFDLIFVMAGPDNATTSVPAILMYLTTFRGNQFAKGAAIATILLLLISLLIIPYLVSTFRSKGAS